MNLSSESPLVRSLKRALEIKKFPIEIIGSVNPTLLAWTCARFENPSKPSVIICPTQKEVENFCHDLQTIKNTVTPIIIEPFDETPYSGLYPSSFSIQSRTKYLYRAAHAQKTDIFVGCIEAFLQKTIPKKDFLNFELSIRHKEELDLDTLCKQLALCGYASVPVVEDGGAFSRRGDILDVFTPTYDMPLRIEFFGDQVDSLRLFDIETQLSKKELQLAVIVPAREIILTEENLARGKAYIKKNCDEHGIGKDIREELIEPLNHGIFPHGMDYWLAGFYDKLSTPLEAFEETPSIFWLDSHDILRSADGFVETLKDKFRDQINSKVPVPDPESLYLSFDKFSATYSRHSIHIKKIQVDRVEESDAEIINIKAYDTSDLSAIVRAARESKKDFFAPAVTKINEWRAMGMACFIWTGSQIQSQRTKYLLENHGIPSDIIEDLSPKWGELIAGQRKNPGIHIIPRPISHSGRFMDEEIVFIRDDDLYGTKPHRDQRRTKGTLEQRTNTISFADLNPGDLIVHTLHGVGVYEGLKKIAIQTVENEFIQLKYRDGDRLYLPVYRISQVQKYSAQGGQALIDKLGTTTWQKAKVKVRSALKDLAGELLALYAKRALAPGFAFSPVDDDFREFEALFPYDETPDQSKAIDAVLNDMQQGRPMDRLVCGDVGYGKTEVAMRAAYKAAQDKKQVAVLVPTTVLAFQHYQNFKKRFSDTAVNIAMASRFSSAAQTRKDLSSLSEGKVDILIGTHRLLSKDVSFKDLGLLVVDEEQRFGVAHKEKIKRFKSQVDVLTLSATPIPRTLNMGLMGIRDLSIINTPPENRLSIRTFINRFDEETIRKAIQGEIKRGGQVFFVHNRVQSIHGFADQIRRIVPEARLRIGHGQMADDELEQTMLDFYNHEFDVLLCTTIIESGLDLPTANTIIVDRADTFGLSQLYQLRGRVGRGKERAYAYLLIPAKGVLDKTAQERLKIIQDHSDLGSGFHIAHHDLELRGSGNILGEDQSGHIAAVGYELYMELLEQALAEAKGETILEEIEPEINLRIPALIPDSYIEDIRIRLGYYKTLGDINDESDLDRIENELLDRFGKIPEQVLNLFGIMLIRKICKDLAVKDISAGPKNLSLLFSNSTKVAPEAIVRLATQDSKKYQLSPDQRLIIRLNSSGWPQILEELKSLKKRIL